MIIRELTNRAPAARTCTMQGNAPGNGRSGQRRDLALAVLLGGAVALSGCVSVAAPDKPIVIELNINIKQEVIYKLAADAGNTIEDNPDIF
jgi:hypothetical protein